MTKLSLLDDRDDTIKIIPCNVISFPQIVNKTLVYGSVWAVENEETEPLPHLEASIFMIPL